MPSASTPTDKKEVMKEMLFGASAPVCRQHSGDLMLGAAKHFSTRDVEVLRAAMAGPPSRFRPPAAWLAIRDTWRTVQVRQFFRFSLEALLHWTLTAVGDTPKTTQAFVGSFLDQVTDERRYGTARIWLAAVSCRIPGR
jgi:hypothetical protein